MSQPLINILIRTSNRPLLFKRLLRSIERQTYKNVRLIVSYDTIVKPKYVPQYIETISVIHIILNTAISNNEAWYNLYVNALMNKCKEGYMIIIDDDDYITMANRRALWTIVERLDPNTCNIIQFKRNGRVKPKNGEEIGIQGKIGMPCFILHSKFKSIASFGGETNSDFIFIQDVIKKIGFKFIPQVLVECDRRSFGQ